MTSAFEVFHVGPAERSFAVPIDEPCAATWVDVGDECTILIAIPDADAGRGRAWPGRTRFLTSTEPVAIASGPSRVVYGFRYA